jgi:hypothetical protein
MGEDRITMDSANGNFVSSLSAGLQDERFTLMDIGCSGGIDPFWRHLGDRLQAFGFDPNIEEINRLNSSADAAGIEYIAAFVGVPPDHPIALRRLQEGLHAGNPWARLSVARTLQLRDERSDTLTHEQMTRINLWHRTRLADPEQPIFLSAFAQERHLTDIDFIKIDADGPDFDILCSVEDLLGGARVLGLRLEVNFFGRDNDADHTFHNTDRFMRRNGFELVDLSVRKYALAALPARYVLTLPAQAESGRPFRATPSM